MADGYPAETGAAKLDRYFTTESGGPKRPKALYRKEKGGRGSGRLANWGLAFQKRRVGPKVTRKLLCEPFLK